MNVIEHTKYVWELQDFIPDKEIEYFLSLFEFYNPSVSEDFRNEARQNDSYVIDKYEELDSFAWKWINNANKYYVKENPWIYYKWDSEKLVSDQHLDVLNWQGKNIIRVYNKSDNYHWHGDQSPSNHAEFSYIVYLNDDFEGGRTLFLNDKIGVSPKKGSVLCFPVDHYHIHKGTTVSSGVKKILWNCVYRHEILMSTSQSYLAMTNVPRSSKRCIW